MILETRPVQYLGHINLSGGFGLGSNNNEQYGFGCGENDISGSGEGQDAYITVEADGLACGEGNWQSGWGAGQGAAYGGHVDTTSLAVLRSKQFPRTGRRRLGY